MTFKSFLYKALKYSNDFNAIKKGKVIKRVCRRTAGKGISRLMK